MTRRRLAASALAALGATAVAGRAVGSEVAPKSDGEGPSSADGAGGCGDAGEAADRRDDADATLVVADADSGDRLYEIPVRDGQEVTLAYTHSVERTPVRDVYVVDGDRLRAERMVFHSFGAGLPTDDVERAEEGYVVEGEGAYETLRVVPGSIAGHELVVGDDRYDLVEPADGGVVLFVSAGDEADPEGGGSRGTADREKRTDARDDPP